MKQINSDYLAIGNKYPNSNDPNRYTKRVETACNEMLSNPLLATGERLIQYGVRYQTLMREIPILAEKYNVKVTRLFTIFEITQWEQLKIEKRVKKA